MTQNQYIPEAVYIPHFGKDTELVGVEIGVMTACGSVALLDRLPNLTLYCIDPWRSFPGAPFEAGREQEQHDLNHDHAMNRLAQYGKRAVVVRMTSDGAVNYVPDTVDFVHIDGHHTEEQAFKDIINYFPKVRHNGVISGHDYIQVPDVTLAVNKVFPVEHIKIGEDFTWWVYNNAELKKTLYRKLGI